MQRIETGASPQAWAVADTLVIFRKLTHSFVILFGIQRSVLGAGKLEAFPWNGDAGNPAMVRSIPLQV